MLKKLLGLVPNLESDGSYSPSKVALKMATSDTTDFENISYTKYDGKKSKILMICTEQKNMKMENGKLFSTGNHPVETLVPMLHLQNAGFEFDIVTPTGKPVVLEMWAFPEKDEHVKGIFNEFKARFENPGSLKDFVDTSITGAKSQSALEEYAAVYIPGGHGAMLGLPDNENVGKVLHWAHENNLFTIALCHGPAVLLASSLNNQSFIYDGYELAVFPDSVDKMTPKIGYLPGGMPWWVEKSLTGAGAKSINKKADKTVCLDRRLITGASPSASNNLGKLAANTLLNTLK